MCVCGGGGGITYMALFCLELRWQQALLHLKLLNLLPDGRREKQSWVGVWWCVWRQCCFVLVGWGSVGYLSELLSIFWLGVCWKNRWCNIVRLVIGYKVSEMVNCLHYFIVDDDGVCGVLNTLSFDSLTLKWGRSWSHHLVTWRTLLWHSWTEWGFIYSEYIMNFKISSNYNLYVFKCLRMKTFVMHPWIYQPTDTCQLQRKRDKKRQT